MVRYTAPGNLVVGFYRCVVVVVVVVCVNTEVRIERPEGTVNISDPPNLIEKLLK